MKKLLEAYFNRPIKCYKFYHFIEASLENETDYGRNVEYIKVDSNEPNYQVTFTDDTELYVALEDLLTFLYEQTIKTINSR